MRGVAPILGVIAFMATEAALLALECTSSLMFSLLSGVPLSAAALLGMYAVAGGDVGELHPAVFWIGIAMLAVVGLVTAAVGHICG